MMSIDSKRVKKEIVRLEPVDNAIKIEDDILRKPFMLEEMSIRGVFGSVRKASWEAGEKRWPMGAGEIAQNIKSLLKAKRDESIRKQS